MTRVVRRAAKVAGLVRLPGDKSISHRYALLAAIAEGRSLLHHFASSQDCHSTLKCLQGLGVSVQEDGNTVTIEGRGLRGLSAPRTTLDAGNSGTTIRLLSGILAGHPFDSYITGDESLQRRPMGRILQPLRMMGAGVECRDGEFPPLRICGGALRGIRYPLPIASAQVKSCVLLAGLYADQPCAVQETIPTRDHTEVALRQFGANVCQDGNWIEVEPSPSLRGQRLEVPGDLSGGVFFLVAAALIPGSNLLLRDVGLNRRRCEVLDYLRAAGMNLSIENARESAGEPRGDIRVSYNPALLDATMPPIHGKLVAALIDEIPVLSILGSQIKGGMEISEARELRLKESDRIAALASNLRSMGAEAVEKQDGLKIAGGQRLHGADIDTRGDHRIAMAFSVAALVADGETRVHDAECADVSFPGFYDNLERVTNDE
jgi:3-phosphoshikimate 1-carboxyvinyltransferase